MRRLQCPALLALPAARRAAGALAPPLSYRYFILFDSAHTQEAQSRSIGFRLPVRAPFLWTGLSKVLRLSVVVKWW